MDDDLSVVRQRLENEKIAAEIKLLNCNVKAAGAQAEKVQLEIHQLKSDSGWAANFGKKVWPVLSSAVTLAISLIALTVSLFTNARQTEDQHRQERDKLLSENLA